MSELFNAPDTLSASKKEDDDYDVFSTKPDSQSFEQKISDISAVIEGEETGMDESNKKVIEKAASTAAEKTEKKVEKQVVSSPGQIAKNATEQILDEENGKTEPETEQEPQKEEPVFIPEPDFIDGAENDPLFSLNKENPLNLLGRDLETYKMLQTEFADVFEFKNLTNMGLFYKYKVRELGYLLSEYPLLNCMSLDKELKEIDTNHSIMGLPNGTVIAEKLNRISRQRHRLSEILIQIHRQYHAWDASLEMLKGKLWLTKELKGQHKREGVVADHMADIVHYVSALRCTLEAGKYIDNLLVAAADSVSRQLACIQEKQYHEPAEINNDADEDRKKFDDMDVIDEGTSIKPAPTDVGRTGKLNFGNENDEFSTIG